jgi:3-oxoacyl-[acyl-carrier protein] reductase
MLNTIVFSIDSMLCWIYNIEKGGFTMNFTGKTAISTGAASGMGLLFVQNFAALGGNVVLCDVNEQALNEKVNEINSHNKGRAIGVVCDVRDYAQVCNARDKAVAEFGSIDIMANFAGGTAVRVQKVDRKEYPEFPDVPIDVFDWGIDVNLKGPFYFAHAVLKQMREQNSGLIINIGSITGQEGSSYGMDYSTSKAGLMFGLTKSIAQYGSKYGIRCVCVSPGPVLTRAAMANMKTLLGRAADPQEIVDLCLFLASDKGQFINGENIMIDGGRNAMTRG